LLLKADILICYEQATGDCHLKIKSEPFFRDLNIKSLVRPKAYPSDCGAWGKLRRSFPSGST
jgi:hypothetical protein